MADYLSQIVKKMRLQELDNIPNLFFVQKYLGVKPSSLLVPLLIFVVIVSLISNASRIVISLTCCLIPAYFTFVALQSRQNDDNIKYLTYWIIYALIETVSPIVEFVLPTLLYTFLRIGITLALLHPSFNLSVKVYRDYIEPLIKKYEKDIDSNINVNKAKEMAENQYKRFSRN